MGAQLTNRGIFRDTLRVTNISWPTRDLRGLLQTIDAVKDVIANLSVGTKEVGLVFDDPCCSTIIGMGTAFSSSLFGLAGSLVLGFLNFRRDRRKSVLQ